MPTYSVQRYGRRIDEVGTLAVWTVLARGITLN